MALKSEQKIGLIMIFSSLAGYKSLLWANDMFIPGWYNVLLIIISLLIGLAISIFGFKFHKNESYNLDVKNKKRRTWIKLMLMVIISLSIGLFSSGYVFLIGYGLNHIDKDVKPQKVDLNVVEVWCQKKNKYSNNLMAGVTVERNGVYKEIDLYGVGWNKFDKNLKLLPVRMSRSLLGFEVIEHVYIQKVIQAKGE